MELTRADFIIIVLLALLVGAVPAFRFWLKWNWFWSTAPIWLGVLLLVVGVLFVLYILLRGEPRADDLPDFS